MNDQKSKEGKESLRLSKSQYKPSKLWVDLSVDCVCKITLALYASVRAITFISVTCSMC